MDEEWGLRFSLMLDLPSFQIRRFLSARHAYSKLLKWELLEVGRVRK